MHAIEVDRRESIELTFEEALTIAYPLERDWVAKPTSFSCKME